MLKFSGERSKASLAFEKKWSDFQSSDKLIPGRIDFDILDLVDYLPQLVIAEIDLGAKKMPIKFAGTAIRDFVGFELTNVDFIDFDKNHDPEQGWKRRAAYHGHPCGRFEILEIGFSARKTIACGLTILPLLGRNGEQQVAVFVEPEEIRKAFGKLAPKMNGEKISFGIYIDLGAGTPQGPGDDALVDRS